MLLERIRQFFIPPLTTTLHAAHETDMRWLQAREQILTGILRVAAALCLLALAASAQLIIDLGLWSLGMLYGGCIGIITLLALRRQIGYRFRASTFLIVIYIVAFSEIVSFGYTEDAYGYLTTFALLSLILFGSRFGVGALLTGVITLASFGLGQSTGLIRPVIMQIRPLTPELAITTSMLFLACVGVVQVAITVLLNHIDAAWQESQRVRNLLEQRVIERTHELAEARDQALSLSQYRSEQNQFLSTLHQTALDLLQHRDREQLLQGIVDRASDILEAPYGQLLMLHDDMLVINSHTTNLPYLKGDRYTRQEATLSWRAMERREPVIVEQYAHYEGRLQTYDPLNLQAVASFPIMIGQRCLGVLGLARTTADHPFTADEIQKGQLFSQLAAVVIDNADLYSTALHEIAERRAVEEALKAQNAELDAFAHTVAHDLKGPLASLVGNAELLQMTAPHESAQEVDAQLGDILVVSRKMNAIIDALLTLSSVRSRRRVHRTTIAMAPIVAESLQRLQPLIRETQATIMLPVAWPAAHGYAPWVEEIWVNYLSNAIKYGGSPPQIALGADQLDDGLVRFWVQDNGRGLTAEEQAQLFRPFTRLQAADIQGHGLGLSIVQRIAAQLGGGVGVESDQQGSRFFFTLPPPDYGAQE
jgi:signal transduction histidine kinase